MDTLDAETTRFVREHPYRVVSKYYAQTRHVTARFRQEKRVDAPELRWGVLVGDVLHELSSVLDHIAWQFALRHKANPDRRTAWPVCMTEEAWDERWCKDMVRHILDPHRTFIRERQPYHAPNGTAPESHAFAMLRELSRVDKHKILHTALLVPLDVDVLFDLTDVEPISADDVTMFVDEPIHHGAKFARVVGLRPAGPNPDVQVKAKLSLYVAFVGPDYGWMDRGMVFYVLRAIRNTVEKVIDEASDLL